MASKRADLTGMFITVIFSIIFTVSYLSDTSRPSSVPPIFLMLFTIITLIFDYKQYHNKNLYQSVGAVFLVLLLVVIYFIFPHGEDIQFFIVTGGITILLLLYLIYQQPKEWEKLKKN